jgi:hypothetical protein
LDETIFPQFAEENHFKKRDNCSGRLTQVLGLFKPSERTENKSGFSGMHLNLKSKQGKSVLFLFLLALLLSLPMWFGLFESKKTIRLPSKWLSVIQHTSEVEKEDLLFVYVGYAGCSLECPIALTMLAELFSEAKSTFPLLFVDLLSEPEKVSSYAEQFHANFTTLPLSNDSQTVMNQLSVWFRNVNSVDKSEPVVHSDRLYILKKQVDRNYVLLTSFTGSSPQTKNHLSDWLKKN